MSGFESPNYTQVPNDLFDIHMAHMGMAELKVLMAIMRWTFGFHLTERHLSLTKLQAITGLSRSSVMDGIAEAVGHGFIEKEPGNGVTLFRVNVMHPITYKRKNAGSVGLPLLDKAGGSATLPALVALHYQTSSPTLPPSIKESIKESNNEINKNAPERIKSNKLEFNEKEYEELHKRIVEQERKWRKEGKMKPLVRIEDQIDMGLYDK